MRITFLNIKGTEFISQGHRVNQVYYMEILKQLCEGVCRKRPELRPNDLILYHNNAPPHEVLTVKQHFLSQK